MAANDAVEARRILDDTDMAVACGRKEGVNGLSLIETNLYTQPSAGP
jgi:hypothetical protein